MNKGEFKDFYQTTIFDFINNYPPFRIIELFGGIGACTAALKKLNLNLELVDYVEIDKFAVASFNAINETNFKPQDITKWDKNFFENIDLIIGGFPCQDISLAGLQKGIIKGETRSGLMYEMMRIIEKIKPKYVVAENVKNILSKKHRHNFDNYLKKMEELGYKNYYQVLNAKDFGIPQNRERLFCVSILGDHSSFNFPKKYQLKLKLNDFLENEVDQKYYLTSEQVAKIKSSSYNLNRLRIQKKDFCYTLCAHDSIGPKCVKFGNSYRKLTPKECWRLMGFKDEDFEKASKVNSNSQLYKQAGNSIVVNVLEVIFKELFKGE